MIRGPYDLTSNRRRPLSVVALLNIAVTCFSGLFAFVALVSPSTLTATAVSARASTKFFVHMYAVRAMVIAVGVITVSVTLRRAPRVATLALAGTGIIQCGDAVIAARLGTPGVAGAAVAASIHLASAGLLLHYLRQPEVDV